MDTRQWCIVCGQPRGNCNHVIGFTSNSDKAKNIWLAELKRLQNIKHKHRRILNV